MRDAEAQLIHDMQNTAMVLREAAGELHDRSDDLSPAAAARLTGMLARRSEMLVQLLSDLATCHLAGREELDLSLQRVSLPEICRDVVAERQPAQGAPIGLDVAEDAVAVADPIRLTQVLDNLVTNALRYGGPEVSVTARRAGSQVRLSVSDDGPGVPAELVDTVFDAYSHGDSSHGLGGSGLGLRIARQLCEAMGGTLAHDADGRTTFTATLPALPVPVGLLPPDVAATGHAVAFWESDDVLAARVADYVAHGLAAGEAVVVAATVAHVELVVGHLRGMHLDVEGATAAGQLLILDAEVLHGELPRDRHIDRNRFDALLGVVAQRLSRRWRSFRVFGEIVDLYRRGNAEHLALELESCWNGLREEVPFPLLCAYELGAQESPEAICHCHDAVVPA
jgi:two-component sensor histidine kinase